MRFCCLQLVKMQRPSSMMSGIAMTLGRCWRNTMWVSSISQPSLPRTARLLRCRVSTKKARKRNTSSTSSNSWSP
ncbi:cytochrome b5 [Phtheirospermum japonicum]|uniref:Cytochrome b5 n=1 Tax=Phtheirospermum japonicum TaxID=374723 RepID=A0A830C950_9LAMI|nr:cytochrome b5 [Phtheirospermum japonicum]